MQRQGSRQYLFRFRARPTIIAGRVSPVATISAADPLNLAGIVVPGERVPAISGKHLSFRDGAVVETPQAPTLSIANRI